MLFRSPFPKDTDVEPSDRQKRQDIQDHLRTLSVQNKAEAYIDLMGQPSQEYVDGVVEQQMAGMTRQAIEDMIVEQYAGEMGVDGDTVRGYIADMSDEDLFAKVEEAIAQAVREQYAAASSMAASWSWLMAPSCCATPAAYCSRTAWAMRSEERRVGKEC